MAKTEGDETAVVMYFKERVYATFTGLAIVLVVALSDTPDPDHALFGLLIGVLGITAAGFVSDVISHLVVRRQLPSGRDLVVLLRVASGGFSTVVTPGILILLGWVEVIPFAAAITAATVVYIATLAVIGWFAVRGARLGWWRSVLALGLLIALGLAVVGLQTLAHSI